MADVKKINDYAIKDEFVRQIANIANNKFLIDDNGATWSLIWSK